MNAVATPFLLMLSISMIQLISVGLVMKSDTNNVSGTYIRGIVWCVISQGFFLSAQLGI